MSALYLVTHADPARRAQTERALRASFALQGFSQLRTGQWPAGCAGWYETPDNSASASQWRAFDDGFIACVGTLFFHGESGPAALEKLWRSFEGRHSLGSAALSGEYQVVIVKAGQVWSFGDALGMIKLYEVPQAGTLSTSWLACAATCATRVLDPVGALDYLFSGANHGIRTPFEEVRIVDPALALELSAGLRIAVYGAKFWQPDDYYSHEQDALEAICERLVTLARAYGGGFHGRVKSALSGGFDSRLILAALLAAGETPRLHVYGSPDNEDVRIAQQIDRSLRLGLQSIDKRELDRQIASDSGPNLLSNLYFFDGLPIDGILDDGSDRATRLNQSRDGALALNGGGGEVLRNFFYLADRRFTAADIVKVFYSGFDPAAVRSPAALQAYRDYLTDTIEAEVGAAGLLSRQHVELIYPLIRGRYWTSRNNSIAARSGHFLTPLLDPQIVKASARLPMAWKDYGKFEAKLIRRLSPELAGYSMVYGFSPAEGPGLSYQLKMWLQHQRPPWVRAASATVKRRLKSISGHIWSAAGFNQPIHGRNSPLSDLINPVYLTSDDQVARLRTLAFAMDEGSL